MKKTYVIDTNILLDDPSSLNAFDDCNIVIPFIVVEEMDRHKDRKDICGANARSVARKISNFIKTKKNELKTGIELDNGSTLFIFSFADLEAYKSKNYEEIIDFQDNKKGDNLIIEFVRKLRLEDNFSDAVLVSRDVLLRIKCNALDIPSEDYRKDSAVKKDDEVYTGIIEDIAISDELYQKLYIDFDNKNIVLTLNDLIGDFNYNFLSDYGIYPNSYVFFRSGGGKKCGPFRFDLKKEGFVKLFEPKITNYSPRNVEQKMALDMLMNPDIVLCSISGKAGSGKTLLSIAAGLEQVSLSQPGNSGSGKQPKRNKGQKYDSLVITKPVIDIGDQSIGFLPGPQPLDAKVLTPNGWTTMGQLKLGDEVISRDGKPTKVIGIYPKGKKQVYKITTTENTSTECCEDHLWFTSISSKDLGSVKSTKQIFNSLVNKNGELIHRLPRNEPVIFNKQNLPLAPYTLGAILGDGTTRERIRIYGKDKEVFERINKEISSLECVLHHQKNSIAYSIKSLNQKNFKQSKNVSIKNNLTNEISYFSSIVEANKETKISLDTLYQMSSKNRKNYKNFEINFLKPEQKFKNPIKNILDSFGLLECKGYNKFIPEIYKYSSTEDRLALLQGLMDTDGTIKKGGEASFCSTSKRLSQDVIEIVQSLGGRAILRKHHYKNDKIEIKGNIAKRNCDLYEFTISMPKHLNPFHISRKSNRHNCHLIINSKIKSIEPTEIKEVQCIMVDNPEHLYITDDFIVTHNTLEDKMGHWLLPFKDNIRYLLNKGKKDPESERVLQYYFESGTIEMAAITFMRGRSIANSFIIIDECQNITNHEMKTILTRVGENAKIILLGDLDQVDSLHLDKYTNGLINSIEKFKDSELSAHITLQKGERSKIATLASDIL